MKSDYLKNVLLGDSRKFEFYLEGNEPKVKESVISFKYRGQNGWKGISQKICVEEYNSLCMGISTIVTGVDMDKIPVAHEFCDFLLYGKGSVLVDGLEEIKVEEGEYMNFKEKVVRSSNNESDDIIVGIWFQKAGPSYKFSEEE